MRVLVGIACSTWGPESFMEIGDKIVTLATLRQNNRTLTSASVFSSLRIQILCSNDSPVAQCPARSKHIDFSSSNLGHSSR